MQTVLLIFTENITNSEVNEWIWAIQVTADELHVLNQEIDTYNHWIDMLKNGTAPLNSYREPQMAYQLLIQSDPQYQKIFESESQIIQYESEFNIIELSVLNETEQEYARMYRQGEIDLDPSTELVRLITQKYDPENFGMGYNSLPLTQHLISKGSFILPK